MHLSRDLLRDACTLYYLEVNYSWNKQIHDEMKHDLSLFLSLLSATLANFHLLDLYDRHTVERSFERLRKTLCKTRSSFEFTLGSNTGGGGGGGDKS